MMEQIGQLPGSLNTARYYLGGCGTQTAALAFGGTTATASTGATEEYDGSTWTSNPKFKYSKISINSSGTQTAALAFGGEVIHQLQEQQKNMMVQLGQILLV
jgi:hypothetical protein